MNITPLHLLTLVLVSLTSACSFVAPKDPNWPEYMPSKGYYQSYFAEDESNHTAQTEDDYLEWVVNFYTGTPLYRRGWHKMIEEVRIDLQGSDQLEPATQKLWDIGEKVSAEWAKDRRHRVINTRHVFVWGTALQKAIELEETLVLADKVYQDVDALLAGHIVPEDIQHERYYENDPHDEFAMDF